MHRRWFLALVVSALAGGVCLGAEEAAPPRKPDAFFAGSVMESTPEKLVVSRTNLGRKQSRTFIVTPDTKVEGELALKARVTVRYTTDDSGDTATLRS